MIRNSKCIKWDKQKILRLMREYSTSADAPLSLIKATERYFGSWRNAKLEAGEPYGVEFNEELKNKIRIRDNYRCQQCFRHQDELFTKSGKKRNLIIHHIDYYKRNSRPENLISLCNSCHSQTNFTRKRWTKYFNKKINF